MPCKNTLSPNNQNFDSFSAPQTPYLMMGLQTISILTEGVWASLTGGWFYDKKQSDFSNLFHLYIWLTFLYFPFINYLLFNTWISWLIYCLFVALIFTVVKSINEYFHRIFDTGKCIKDETISDADPASSSLMCNDGDSAEKETLEMVPLSHNDEDDLQQPISITEVDAENNVTIAIETNNNNHDDNCSNEITSKTIDLKADVHCNHDTDSSIGNLSLLFKSEDDENREIFENQNSKENAIKLVSESEISLSNMTAVYAKGNSSNNSVGVLENSNSSEQMPTFRRARSEIETIKSSDKSSKTPLVPPSHPVSLEVIHSKEPHKNKPIALGKNRFDKDEIEMLEIKTPKNVQQKPAKTGSSQLEEWEVDENFNKNKMGRIEENSEKPIASCSSAYFKKDCDSSEDGDESEISLCTNGSIKINKKLSKQPMRKARFSTNRKRSKSSAGRSAAAPDNHKCLYYELNERFRSKPSNIVNTSDEEYANEVVRMHAPGKKHSGKHFSMPYRLQYQSDTSSSLPSSSSSSMASDDRTKVKTDMEQYSMNFPSTSSGIISKPVDNRKRMRGKYAAKAPKYLWNSSLEENSLIKYEKRKLRQLLIDHQTLSPYDSKSHNTENPESIDLRGSRSNSIRDGGESSKNSVVCLPSSLNIIEEILSNGSHWATSHEDTTVGAVHVFQDERGNWFTYTFGENSTGLAKGLCPLNPFSKVPSASNNNADANNEAGPKFKFSTNNALIPSNSIYYLNNRLLSIDSNSGVPSINTNNNNNNNNNDGNNTGTNLETSRDGLVIINGHSSQTPDSVDTNLRNIYFDRFPMFDPNSDVCSGLVLNNQSFSHSFQRSQQQLKASKYYYEMKICDLFSYKIRFDRLELSAFLDRSLTNCEMICSILLAILVAVFSSILLHKEFFKDIRLFVFCFVVAGSQYTLLKSVQPDAASPTHGFNRVAIYSRPIYFCLVSAIILLSNEYYHSGQTWMDDSILKIYGFNLINRDLFLAISNVSQTLILIFPLLFMFGLLPQFNTFVMYIFEHIDIYIFGGTAATMGMISATYSIVRSMLAVGFLYLCAHLFNIKEQQRTPSFSVFCGILVAVSYLLSRSTSDPSLLWNVIYEFLKTIKNFTISLITNFKSKSGSTPAPASTTIPITPNSQSDSLKSSRSKTDESIEALIDPLPEKLKNIALSRFESDMITCIFVTISVFSVHVSSIFKLQPFFNDYISIVAIVWSFLLHYLLPQFRKQLPWLLFSSPICKSHEYKKFEVSRPAKNMWFEKVQAWLWLIEKNILYPLLFLGYITTDCPLLIKNYGHNLGLFFLVLFGFKSLRSSFNDPSHNYIIVIFTHLFFTYDFRSFIQDHDNIFLMNYFIMSFVYYKVTDFLLKFRFVITYVAPWQITWGSAFHAFAQPFSVPHSALLLVQIFVSSLLSAPLQPILGSAIFFTSYVRPIKFWERDYNTKRVDHSNTRLASQIDKAQIGSDDNNLNSIFYEHLTRSLQHSLYGDLALGRWGDVSQGDCFVLASDNLNCLLHIIELGNGFVTFQVRGLEFRGTYCQQREVEAITENVSDDDGCCCCETPRFNGVLSINAAFNQRWLSWEVTQTNYVLEGYSISEHIASTIVQPYDLRKALINYYVKSIIYFCITNENFIKWIKNEEIRDSLDYLNEKNFVDLDPTFNLNIDDDYDILASGVTRSAFKSCYRDWIKYCIDQGVNPSNLNEVKKNEESVITLCFGLSLLARRALGTASHHNSASMNVEFFLYGFHALFKGDFRIHCPRDEWVFQDMDFLNKVVSPSVRMSLKLHQDQFINYEEYENSKTLFESISQYQKSMVISHEADPVWRKAILSNVPSLLALRHVFDEGTDHYKVIMLNKRFLNFRIIKINRECVRGLWAGQQQELIFLRNRNPERGSIQNAKQVLRNIINSSCDQPIGYPIYVSPLTTSFSETSASLNQIIGPSLSFSMFKRAIVGFYNKIRNRCNEVCSSNSRQQTELNFTAARLTKSESNDRGLDDPNSAKSSLIVSTHSQIVQFSNYSQYMKKRVLKTNDEEALHSNSSNLVNRNVISLLQNSLNHQTESPSSNVGNPVSGSSKTTPVVQSDISMVTMEQHSKSIIVEKSLSLPKGDAV